MKEDKAVVANNKVVKEVAKSRQIPPFKGRLGGCKIPPFKGRLGGYKVPHLKERNGKSKKNRLYR